MNFVGKDHFNDDFSGNFNFGIDFINHPQETTMENVNKDALVPSENILVDCSNWDDDISHFISGGKAKMTLTKEKSDYKRFKMFLLEINEGDLGEIEYIPEKKLDELLCRFFMHAKKHNKDTGKYDGDEYQPDTLSSIRNSLQRIIHERGSLLDLRNSANFDRSRKVLKAKRKGLKKMGLGNKPNATRPLEDEELEKLKILEYFGWNTPEALQNLMWWCITTQFGYRARDEARKLCFVDIKLSFDGSTNKHYLEWDTERGSKTRTGEYSSHERSFNPKAYETGEWDCPVNTYKHFLSHRPVTANEDNSPFFLSNIPTQYIKNEIWYYPRPLGKNKLGEILSKASKLLGNNNNKSRNKVANHSARKTTISKLLDQNVHPLHVSQLSGHKNINSLKSYHTASRSKQQEMSNILASNNRNTASSSRNNCNNNLHSCSHSKNASSSNNIQLCRNEESVIPFSIQQQLMENWDPVSSPKMQINHPILQGATFGSNCNINVQIYTSSPPQVDVQVKKRKRIFIEDDSQ